MNIDTLTLRNFRNYREIVLSPHEGVNLFFGQNGSGKTNLLEAIHYCALGKSHRVSNDASVVRTGEAFASISLTVRNQWTRQEISVRLTPAEDQKKVICLNQKKIQRFSDMMGCLQCVIFSPEDLGLIKEGPSMRRKYLDMMISQLNKKYFIALQQYRSGLEQRNAILKNIRQNQMKTAVLEDFERAMVIPAMTIIEERKKAVEELKILSEQTYRQIADNEDEQFHIEYHPSVKEEGELSESLIKALDKSREDDIRLGQTSVGPHRDDLMIWLNKKNMKVFASQGQIRTAALSLKLAQMKYLKEISGETPVLLLDDVMSELDRKRRTRLLYEIENYQTFITGTNESDLEEDPTKRVYQVSMVNGMANVNETNRGKGMEKLIFSEPDFT